MVNLIEATISLALQVTALVFLAASVVLKNKKSYRNHGITVTIALLLHLSSVFLVMMPTFGAFLTSPGMIVYDAPVIIMLIHVTLGISALVLGVWLVVSWRFSTDFKRCFANKKIMRPTIAVWTVSIMLGVIMYIIFWASSLFA